MEHESLIRYESAGCTGVSYKVRRISFARRLELLSRLRSLAVRAEFERAGQTVGARIDAALLEGEIDRALLECGLESIDGLTVDGVPATPEVLIERGPEGLCREIAVRVRAECFLGEEQRKN